jgi:hypothetical protein
MSLLTGSDVCPTRVVPLRVLSALHPKARARAMLVLRRGTR